MKSIFELERRFNFDLEFDKLLEYMIESQIFYTFESLFHMWPYNEDSFDIGHYFKRIDEYFTNVRYEFGNSIKDDEFRLLYYDFLLNYINWIVEEQMFHIEMGDEKILEKVQNSILYQLEQLNYTTKEADHIYIIKRNFDVDSVLHQLETTPDLRILLLSFNDFRIENDLNEKRLILKRLADYLEPQRPMLEKLDNLTTDNVFFLFNRAFIRHNDNKQINIKDDELLNIYDDLFKLIIHLIRLEDVNKINEKTKKLKQ